MKQLIILAALTAFGAFSFDMYLPAFPEMAQDLGTTPGSIQLTLMVCLIGMALGQLVVGPLSDRYGRRRPAVIGVVGYTVLSLAAAAAPTIEIFTGLRFLQGFAAGAGIVIGRAVVRDQHSGAAASRYFSRLVLVFGLAPMLAPSLGALILRFTSWRGIFVVLTVLGALAAVGVLRVLRETLPPERRRDSGAAELLSGARMLLTDRVFVGYALAQGLTFAGMFAYLSSSSFVLQNVFGLSAQLFGALFGLNALGFVLFGQLSAWLVLRQAPRRLLLVAMSLTIAAGAVLVVGAEAGIVGVVVAMNFCYIASIGMMTPNNASLALDRHPDAAGTASALIGAVQSLVGVLAGPLVALGGTGSGVPMAVVMFGFAAVSLAVVVALTRRSAPGLEQGLDPV